MRAVGRRDTLGGVVSLLACLAVVAVISLVTPTFDGESRYRYDDVAVSQWGHLREFDARVTSVRLARSIDISYQEPLTTQDRYVVVTLEAAARTRTQYFANIELRTRDNRRYDPRPEWATAGPPSTQPGFSSRGDFVFEVPATRIAGAMLFVGPTEGEIVSYDAAVVVDLGLGDDVRVERGRLTLPDGITWVTA